MKIKVERKLFGTLLENDIKSLINSTALKEHYLSNIVLYRDGQWYQYDLVIILPTRIVVIEAKNTTKHTFIVHETKDTFADAEGNIIEYNTSVVRQVSRLATFLAKQFEKMGIGVESVISIRATQVKSNQGVYKIFRDTDLYYYIKSLEAELALHDLDKLNETRIEVLAMLSKWGSSEEAYLKNLKKAGIDINKVMYIERENLIPKNLTLEPYEDIIAKQRSKTAERLLELEYILRIQLNEIPEYAHSYLLEYPTVAVAKLSEFIIALEDCKKDYPFAEHILLKNRHLSNGRYISDYCKESNIFFSEFLIEVVRVYSETYPSNYNKSSMSGVVEIQPLDLERIVYTLRRGR